MKKDRIRVYLKVDATLPISEQQRRIVHKMVAKTQAQCDIEQMKQALEAGDYNQAVEAADRASAVKNNWKVRVSLFCLRAAPRLFRHLHLARVVLLGRHRRSKGPDVYPSDGENHPDPALDENTPVEASAAAAEVAPRGLS